jgi:hypothetical protein
MAVMVAGAAWMGLSGEAQAQALIMPTGPLSLRMSSPSVPELKLETSQIYPGRTMGGGTRILRTNPPPSSLKRRKE